MFDGLFILPTRFDFEVLSNNEDCYNDFSYKKKKNLIFLHSDKTLKSKRVGAINELPNMYLSPIFIFFYTHTHIYIYIYIYIITTKYIYIYI